MFLELSRSTSIVIETASAHQRKFIDKLDASIYSNRAMYFFNNPKRDL